jgi:hypothetical protein
MTASEVATKTGLARPTVAMTLFKLAKSGEVQKAERGYRIVSAAPLRPPRRRRSKLVVVPVHERGAALPSPSCSRLASGLISTPWMVGALLIARTATSWRSPCRTTRCPSAQRGLFARSGAGGSARAAGHRSRRC